MDIRFLGGSSEVGRSSFLLNEELLLDYGIKPTEPPTYPQGALRPKSILVSHGHLDHCGLIPNLADLKPEIYLTKLTLRLTKLLADDTLKIAEQNKGYASPFETDDIRKFEQIARYADYGEAFETNGYSVSFFDGGHIPGSSMMHIEKDNESIFYTGDVNSIATELQNGAETKLPESDVLMIESTYFGKNHAPRKTVEEQFIRSVKETIDNGGCALIPAFAISRTQEIMIILKKHGLNAYVDGMGVDVYNLMARSPEFVKNPRALENAFPKSSMLDPKDRKEIMDEPSIIVTTAGMINGGPVLNYIEHIWDDPNSKIFLTGYQAENTNGRALLGDVPAVTINKCGHTLRLENPLCSIGQYTFSAHDDDKNLKAMVKKFCDRGTEKVITVHGDDTAGFAEWIKTELGVESIAPVNGERVGV